MRTIVLLGLALAAAAAPAKAQQDTIPQEVADIRLPAGVAERVIAFFNDSGTLHFNGRTRIPAGGAVTGDVAVMDGPVTVAGRVEGDLVVVNGDLELVPGAAISGSVTVVGGEVTGAEGARVGGPVQMFAAPLEFAREGEAIVARGAGAIPDSAGSESGLLRDRPRRVRMVLASEGSYNRVEGLPIAFGPVVETAGPDPLRIRARAIFRTEADGAFEAERWGGDVTAEKALGALRVGGAVRSVVSPVEGWQLPDLDNSLSTFVFHRDFRDYYQRQGYSAWLRFAPGAGPLVTTVEFRSERHLPLAAADPWTILRRDDAWRLQPYAASGDLSSLVGAMRWDSRSSPTDPATGWYVDGQVERALRSRLRQPEFIVTRTVGPGAGVPFPVGEREFGTFTHASLDVRRYNRLSPTSRFNVRVLAAGALGRGELPPQRQHTLGGEGSIPGFAHLSLDCRARTRLVRGVPRASDDPVQPLFYGSYGCRRMALLQAEYRGNVDFHFDLGRPDADPAADPGARSALGWSGALGWTVFADAGHAWGAAAEGAPRQGAVDAGAGLLLGRMGVYAAFPVASGGRFDRAGGGPRFFVRLTSRF